jgi:hypothetical protein
MAVENSDWDIVHTLLQEGADPRAQASVGRKWLSRSYISCILSGRKRFAFGEMMRNASLVRCMECPAKGSVYACDAATEPQMDVFGR